MQVIDGLAVLDPARCIGCFACVDVCPQECIDVTGRSAMPPAHGLDGLAASFEGFAVDEVAAENARVVNAGAAEEAGGE